MKKRRKNVLRALAIMLVAGMVFQAAPLTAYAVGTTSVAYAPVTMEKDAEGYYLVKTPADLDSMRNNLSGKYRLANDIDLTGYISKTNTAAKGWYPIGYGYPYFTGVLDGNGKTISGLWSSGSYGICYKGLFSVLIGATVKNLTIQLADAGITGGYEVGAVAGDARDGSVIENVHVIGGSINVTAGGYAGGIVGFAYGKPGVKGVLITDCTVDKVRTNTSGNYSGGIIGVADTGTVIQRCQVTNTISTAYAYAGGIAGAIKGGSKITDSSVHGYMPSAIGRGSSNETVGYVQARASYAGGLAGAAYEKSSIDSSYADVSVSANFYTGGAVGTLYDNSTVTTTAAYGTVTSTYYIAGGLIGEAVGSTISNCYSRGDVKGTTGVGGLVGYFSALGKKTVENCYTTSRVTGIGTTEYGAFSGHSGVTYLGTNFYDSSVNPGLRGNGTAGLPAGAASARPQGKTTTEMLTESTYAGWDFTSIWQLDGDYPTLR